MMIKNAFWLFIVAVVILAVFLPSYTQLQDMKAKNAEYKDRITALIDERDRLEEERNMLIEDPVYLEKVAREKMGLIREGEVVYKIVPANREE